MIHGPTQTRDLHASQIYSHTLLHTKFEFSQTNASKHCKFHKKRTYITGVMYFTVFLHPDWDSNPQPTYLKVQHTTVHAKPCPFSNRCVYACLLPQHITWYNTQRSVCTTHNGSYGQHTTVRMHNTQRFMLNPVRSPTVAFMYVCYLNTSHGTTHNVSYEQHTTVRMDNTQRFVWTTHNGSCGQHTTVQTQRFGFFLLAAKWKIIVFFCVCTPPYFPSGGKCIYVRLFRFPRDCKFYRNTD